MDRLFERDTNGNFLRLWHPTTQHAKTIVEAYDEQKSNQIKVKEGYKTSYDEKDIQLWLEFCRANEIMLEDDAAGELLCLRLILGRDTEFVVDGDITSLIPMGAVEIQPETFLRIMTNWLFHRQQLQQNYVGKKGLAEWLSVSVPTVDRLLVEGMPSKKIRSRRVFNKAAINQWLKS
ncbi:hypothetical protein OAI15_01490 [Flavobacteriaceae bacterium]|nr:hypothetical protein [Flavobacteriaceae bacterium]